MKLNTFKLVSQRLWQTSVIGSVLVVGVVTTGCADMSPEEQVGAVTGAVAGGLIGSAIGSGGGKAAAVGVGAAVGAIAGGQIGRDVHRSSHHRPLWRCNSHGDCWRVR